MPKKKRLPKRSSQRPGWGRPINLDLPDDADAVLERERARLGLDRTSYCRVLVLRGLGREAAA